MCIFKNVKEIDIKLHTLLTSPNDGDKLGNFIDIVPFLFSDVPLYRTLVYVWFQSKSAMILLHLNSIIYAVDLYDSAFAQSSCLNV